MAILHSDTSARDQTTTLALSGLSCASCVGRVEKALRAVPGVHRVSVNLANERATIEHSRKKPTRPQRTPVAQSATQCREQRTTQKHSHSSAFDTSYHALGDGRTLPDGSSELGLAQPGSKQQPDDSVCPRKPRADGPREAIFPARPARSLARSRRHELTRGSGQRGGLPLL